MYYHYGSKLKIKNNKILCFIFIYWIYSLQCHSTKIKMFEKINLKSRSACRY